ncbi:MAG: AAA family ATPase [Alphaproteobacteria bacterium]|nr:AAA family ATPase [Alphaproteobacteria bacterium]
MAENGDQTARYLVTVMMCDLVDSTASVAQSDPEEMFDWIAGYNFVCTDAVRRFGGSLARMTGDGVVAYFGYPRSVEKSGSAAVLAAVQILNELRARPMPRGKAAAVRVGIATGWAVIGQLNVGLPGQEAFAVGDALNLANRLQQAAQPNQILIADETRQLTRGLQLNPIEGLQLKGFEGVRRAWLVDATPGRRGDGIEVPESAPFVGRGQMLELLLEVAKRVEGGPGAAVEIVGDPGMGKTRLVREFCATISREQVSPIIVFENEEHGANVAFACLSRFVRAQLPAHLTHGAPATSQAAAEWLSVQSGLVAGDLPVLTAAIGLGAAPLSPQILQQRSVDMFTRWLRGLCTDRRAVVVVEDAQWLDPSSLSVMNAVAKGLPDAQLLLVFTARPGWRGLESAQATRINLERLDDVSASELARWYLGEAGTDGAVVRTVVATAEGVPLFVEELAKAASLATPETQPVERYHVPGPVQESILAQIDRLTTDRRLVQIAAAIGVEFPVRLVAAVAGRPQLDVLHELAPLVGGGILEQTNPATFRFRHLLVHTSVLASELPRQLVRHNQSILAKLDELDGDALQNRPHVRAKYLFGAADYRAGIDRLLQASLLRFQASQFEEAIGYLNEAKAKLGLIADEQTRFELELRIQAQLGAAWIQLKNFAAPEVAAAYDRAQQLSTLIGKSASEEEFTALWGVWSNRLVGGQVRKGVELGRALTSIAQTVNTRHLAVLANAAGIVTETIAGDLTNVRRHVDFLNRNADPADVHQAITYAIDPKSLSLLYAAHASWLRGDYEYSCERAAEALAHVEASPYEFVKPYVMIFAAVLPLYAGPSAHARELLDRAVATADQFNIAYWQIIGRVWQNVAKLRERNDAEALNLLDNLVHMYRASGATFFLSYQAALSGLKLVEAGEHERGLKNVEVALDLAEADTERFTVPEVYRMCACAYAQAKMPDAGKAALLLNKGFALAQAQGANAWTVASALTAKQHGIELAGMAVDAGYLSALLDRVAANGMSRNHPFFVEAAASLEKR